MMALATRYDVSAQEASSTLAERLPAMCDRDTFTTVVSSTSMKVANITATATIQGLTCGCACGDDVIPASDPMVIGAGAAHGSQLRDHGPGELRGCGFSTHVAGEVRGLRVDFVDGSLQTGR